MIIREIEERDNKGVEELIRGCLIEFGWDKPGCAWTDPNLSIFYQVYQKERIKYWVVVQEGKIIAGCGIGEVEGVRNTCELQKMYALKEGRGKGIAKELLSKALEFGAKHYEYCYLETFSNMICANKFYLKHGFQMLEEPLIESEHYACDRWYIKKLKE